MNTKEVLKKMFTSKFYWLGVITALGGFIMLGYHGYNTIRAMAMMRRSPKEK